MLPLTLLALGASAAAPKELVFESRDGGLWVGDRRIANSPFKAAETEIALVKRELEFVASKGPVDVVVIRAPLAGIAGQVGNIVHVAGMYNVTATWEESGSAKRRELRGLPANLTGEPGWIITPKTLLMTVVKQAEDGARYGSTMLVPTITSYQGPSPPLGAIDPRKPVDCGALFTDPSRKKACEKPTVPVPNAFADGDDCQLASRPANEPERWATPLDEMLAVVSGKADAQGLVVETTLGLSEVAWLVDRLEKGGNGPTLWFAAPEVTILDCSESFRITDFDAAVGSMGGLGLFHSIGQGGGL